MVDDGWAVGIDDLPTAEQDFDWGLLTEVLFQDLDIELVLESTWADGIENPDEELNRLVGMGDYRPAAWFEPFDDLSQRDPDRGDRR
jgi:hypothetical protein